MTNEQINKATIGANKDQAELVKKANLQEKIDKEIKKFRGEFESKFCNNHQKPIRFLRSIFFDEQDGAEQIENFIIEKIKEIRDNCEKEEIKLLNKIINHIDLMWGSETDIDISPITNYIKDLIKK